MIHRLGYEQTLHTLTFFCVNCSDCCFSGIRGTFLFFFSVVCGSVYPYFDTLSIGITILL